MVIQEKSAYLKEREMEKRKAKDRFDSWQESFLHLLLEDGYRYLVRTVGGRLHAVESLPEDEKAIWFMEDEKSRVDILERTHPSLDVEGEPVEIRKLLNDAMYRY